MRNFIIKHFVKNPGDVKNPKTRESYGSVAGGVGIVSNLLLSLLKILAGAIFGSIAILADGINNLSDASASLITLFGFKLAAKKPSKSHPYGHGRVEYITGLVISVMILVIGVTLLRSSIEKTIRPEEMNFSWLSVGVLVLAIGVKLWQTGFNMHVGKLIGSDALLATASDSRNDVISTGAVLLSVLVGKFTGLNIDGPCGILVALFIIYAGFGLVKETISPILGCAPDPQTVKALSDAVCSSEAVLGIHDLIVHDYGPGRLFASVHVEVDGHKDVFALHDEIDNIEKDVYNNQGILLTIHMDPVDPQSKEVAAAKVAIAKAVSEMVGISNFHDVRCVVGPSHTNVVFDVVAEYGCKLTDDEICEALQQKLQKENPAYVAVVNVDRSYV